MKRIFIELDYEGDKPDLTVSHELENLLALSDFNLKRFNCVDIDNLFNVTIGNG